jgi:hypothetical protein
MSMMTPEQEARNALDFGVARSDLSTDAQLAYDRLVKQREGAATPVHVSRAGVVDTVQLAEKNMHSFAVTGWHDRLYLAWVPSGIITFPIDLAYLPDGRQITGKQRLAQRTRGVRENRPRPSLAVSAGHLYLAWTGTGNRVNILADPQNPHGAPVRVAQARSRDEPALCSHQDRLILAWTGIDRRINILADPQNPHGAPVRLDKARGEFQYDPALCSHRGSLVLAWAGTWGRIHILADPRRPHGAPVRLDEARGLPALCSHQDRLILAWTGRDGRVNILADPQRPHGAPVRLDEAQTSHTPVLCSHQDRLILAWSSKDGHLNLARLESM